LSRKLYYVLRFGIYLKEDNGVFGVFLLLKSVVIHENLNLQRMCPAWSSLCLGAYGGCHGSRSRNEDLVLLSMGGPGPPLAMGPIQPEVLPVL